VREGSWVFHRLTEDGPGAKTAGRLRDLLPANDPVLALDLKRLAEVKEERSRAAADYFRRNARRWHELRSLHVDEAEVENVLRRLLPTTGVGDLLDVGTGTGRMLEVFGPRFGRGLGIDLSHDMLAVARANLERSGLKNLVVRKGDMYQLAFPDASFDAVTVHQVLHFAHDPARAIAEAARVLRPGGHLLVADFAPHDLEYLRREHEHRRLGFGDSQVCDWFEATYLKTVEVEHLPGDPLTVTVWLAAKPGAGES
jgi:ArsR family transcriptional regulator